MLNRRKNGSEYWERIAVSPLRDASRRISRFVAVCEDVTEHKRREEGLHQLARVDPLTGVSNRRHLMERAGHEWVRADRFGLPLALVMLDIDHFKRVNDEYGHAVGDRAICAVATICVDCVREIDIVGRYGGEEFVIVLPGTGLEGARKLGQRLRKRIADVVLEDEEGRPFKLTASLGIADLVGGAGLDRLLASADAALYRAKRSGRNCVVTATHGGGAA
jgi:diguanylate cyclase (GGDEF)-like protein